MRGSRWRVRGGEAEGRAGCAVQGAEHVEQRRGMCGRGRYRAGAGGVGAGGRLCAADGLQSGAAQPHTDRGPQVVVDGRAEWGVARVRIPGGGRSPDGRGHGEFRAVGGRVRSVRAGDRGGRQQPRRRSNRAPGDIANLGFARRAVVSVCLVGDIDRGGVIAAWWARARFWTPRTVRWSRAS